MGLATAGVAPFLANSMPKAKPTPEVEIYARALGRFSLTCPNCGTDHPVQSIPWRQQHFECSNCHARFRLGLGFEFSKRYPAYLMGKYNNFTANRWNPRGTGYDGAFLTGTIEWQCPRCSIPYEQSLQESRMLGCLKCGSTFSVSLLIYRASHDSKIRAPFDSVVKGLYVKTIQSVASETPNSSNREECSR